jgi:hypothetical protein
MRHLGLTSVTQALVISAAMSGLGLTSAGTTASGKEGRTALASSPPTALPFTNNHQTKMCSSQRCSDTISSTTGMTAFQVKAMSGTPVASASTLANSGTLNLDQRANNPLMCGGYPAQDSNSLQFYLGDTTLGNVFYLITDTVTNTDKASAQFCLGAVYKFKTMSGKDAPAATLPNNLPGFVGLLPRCTTTNPGQLAANAPCVVSKKQSGKDAVLTVQVLAIGDPWGRS